MKNKIIISRFEETMIDDQTLTKIISLILDEEKKKEQGKEGDNGTI